MRIAQVATAATPVREHGSGSIEGIVWLLTRELVRMGHEVTVFGVAGSEPCGQFVPTLPGPYSTNGAPDDWQLCEWVNLARAVEQSGRFDLVHSHAYLFGLSLQRLSRAPMVHTTHTLPDPDAAWLWENTPDACVTAISHCQWERFPHLRPAAVIPHGLDPAAFTPRAEPDDYLCYLGRFTWGKGPHVAIETARALGMRLLLAGPWDAYFEECVRPAVDGKQVEYLGFLSGPERDRLLGGARALLYPLQTPEPFGLVQAEAMLCGTPVAAVRMGAVAEVVEEGVTGACAAGNDDFADAVRRCFDLDRARIRETAAARFSVERMAREYLRVYEREVAR